MVHCMGGLGRSGLFAACVLVEQGLDAADAVRYAFRTVGKALVVTSMVLIVGFSILALSKFANNADVGLLTAVIIALALVADFLFLPPLLMAIDNQRKPS